MNTQVSEPRDEHIILEVKSSSGTAVLIFVAGVVAVICVGGGMAGIISAPEHAGKASLGILLGLAAGAFALYEYMHFGEVDRYLGDRVECVTKKGIRKCIRYADGIAISFAVRTDGTDPMVTIRGANGESFTVIGANPGSMGSSINPPERDLQKLWDYLSFVVLRQIKSALKGKRAFAVDEKWDLNSEGIVIDGNVVPWERLDVEENQRNGDVDFYDSGDRVARRTMMGDNVQPALTIVREVLQRMAAAAGG